MPHATGYRIEISTNAGFTSTFTNTVVTSSIFIRTTDLPFGDVLSGYGSRYLSAGGSNRGSREYAANVASAQRSARTKTARAFFTGLELMHVQLDEL